jgi:Coenzyme PQQ synthesis protein D (PqqD)
LAIDHRLEITPLGEIAMKGFRIPSYVSTTFFEDSAVLLDSRKNMYHALNGSAADFWKFLMETDSYEDALKEMLNLYQDASDVISNDLEELTSSLAKVGLLETGNSNSKK